MLLCAAALPAAAISIASAISLYGTTVSLNNEALLDAARVTARQVEDGIAEALKIARLLAAFPYIGPSGALCDEAFGIVVETSAVISAAALVDPGGRFACSAGIAATAEQALRDAARGETGRLTVSGGLSASSVSVIGRPDWRLAIAQPLPSPPTIQPAVGSAETWVAVIDMDWNTISGPTTLVGPRTEEEEPLPPPSELVDQVAVYSDEGATYRRAVVAIRGSELFAAAFHLQPQLLAQETAVFLGGVAAPLLTIAFTVVAAWFGIDRLAIRWIAYLRRLTDAYAAGRSSVRAVRMEEAPAELAALGAAFDRMAEAVGERTEAAEAEARARGLLLLELHHRVNNNFQLVSSLISLHKRRASPEAADALSVQERRVDAMATVYRVSYRDGKVHPVELGELLEEIAAAIRAGRSGRTAARVDLDSPEKLPSIVLDRAVPIALLITEICAGGVAGAAADGHPIRISANAGAGTATIVISGLAAPAGGDGLDARMRDLLARQLGASIEATEGGSKVTIAFPVDAERQPAEA